MNKAQARTINDNGYDAREAAREAARVQGKSIGEWLHGAIADHAADHGLAPRDMGRQERVDAVSARLEQMGGRPDADARSAPKERLQRGALERDHEEQDYADDGVPRGLGAAERSAPRGAAKREEGEHLLESAVFAMERRTARTERRTEQALSSLAKLLEETKSRREQERNDVAALSRKLGDLENNLTRRLVAVAESPIRGSLTRFDARLDAVGKRDAAESAAHYSAISHQGRQASEPVRRSEDTLRAHLEAVQNYDAAHLRASPAAVAAAQSAPANRRSLSDAISEISRRQRALERPANEDRPAPQVSDSDAWPSEAAETMALSLREEMATLVAKVDDIRRDALLARQAHSAAHDGEIDAMRADLGAIAQTLNGLAPRESIAALETSIATLSGQVEASRDQGIGESVLRPVEAVMDELRQSLHRFDTRGAVAGLEEELRRIGDKLDGQAARDGNGIARLQSQMEELRGTVTTVAARPLQIDRIEQQVAIIAESLSRGLKQTVGQGDNAASAGGAPAGAGSAPAHFEAIELKLELLAGRLERALSADAGQAKNGADTTQLEQLVRELGLRLDKAHEAGSDHGALTSLQRQIEQLSLRFERSETGLSALPTLAVSMSKLFSHLEATRSSVENTAAQAAREVLKIAADDARQHREPAIEPSLRLQKEVEARADSTLNTVQAMLGSVVDRLSMIEKEKPGDAPRTAAVVKAEVPVKREALLASQQPVPSEAVAAEPSIGAPRDMRLGGMVPREGSAPANKPTRKPLAVPATDESRRADFIAAARRAAATAQAEVSAVQRNGSDDEATRAGLLARSRDYVASHKRPMLMGIAALMMALGVITLMDHEGGAGKREKFATAPGKSVRVVGMAPASQTKVASTAASVTPGAEAPAASPATTLALAKAMAGNDPVQTGSIPSLPTFAAGAPAQSRPAFPNALVAAAESGVVAAQYDLANVFAEGRIVPRDMKLAAKWFEKAADAGSTPAQYRLASLYEKGIGVAADKAKARTLYTKAADAGNPRAMYNLAVLLADGNGHPDYAGAVDWFRKAAQFGLHDSQYNLAVLLARGYGVPQNLVQSYQWFSVAAAAGDADAAKKRDEVGLKLSANDVAVGKALAAAFQPKVPDPAAVQVQSPAGGWDSKPGASRLNSPRSKISSL